MNVRSVKGLGANNNVNLVFLNYVSKNHNYHALLLLNSLSLFVTKYQSIIFDGVL